MANFTLQFTTNEMISISVSQTFRSWVVIFNLRRPIAFFSQLIRYARTCSLYECFILRARRLSSKLLEQGYLAEIFIQEVLWSIRGSYSAIWSLPLTNVKWRSDPWPFTVTPQLIILSTNFMTMIPRLTFNDLRVVSMEHLQLVCHASRERLPLRTPGSVPLFVDFFVLYLFRPNFPNLPCLFSTIHHEYPSVLSRFCSFEGYNHCF